MKYRRSVILSVLLVFFLTGCQSRSGGETDYPTRPIVYIVPWNPGGGTDATSRAMAAVLQQKLGVPVNVVNRTGGGGVVGHLALAQARPDGYTIGAITVELTMMHHTGVTDLTYEQYIPLAMLVNNWAAVSVRSNAPWNSVDDLLRDVRASPGQYRASGTSKGGIWDLARVGFLQAAGVPETALPWVPSQGSAPAFQELLAGGVHVVTSALAEAEALRRAGQVKVLAVMADQRQEAFPEIPTLKEQGIEWSLGGWVGVGAPAGLPDSVRIRLESAVHEAAVDTQFTVPLERAGFNLQYMPSEEFAAYIQQQDSLNKDLLRLAGMAGE